MKYELFQMINGEITIDIILHDDYGNEYDEVPEQPNELINLSNKVNIIRNIPKNFWKGFYAEYQSFYDKSVNKTKEFLY